jgi:hypothetical protein
MADGSQNQIPGLIRNKTMNDEQAQAIRNELKRFAGDLNLSMNKRQNFTSGWLLRPAGCMNTRSPIRKLPGRTSSKRSDLAEPNYARGWSASLPGTVKEMGCRSGQSERVSGYPAA